MSELPQMSRRGILAAAALGSAATLLSTGISRAEPGEYHPAPDGPARDDKVSTLALVTQSEVNNEPTYYEPTGARTSFQYEPTFYSRMETWHQRWRAWTPYHWTVPHRIYCYGVYVNKPGMHGEGRAFDLARLLITNRNTGQMFLGFNGRYDLWRTWTGEAFTTERIRYWGTLASLHYHFRHVISYLDNSVHHNHVHIDNAISGSGDSSYSTSSTTQTLFVQAVCRYLWGYATGIDGVWGPQTQSHSSGVLAQLGSDGVITTQSRWQIFCRGSALHAWAMRP
jgi:hypothetical protein